MKTLNELTGYYERIQNNTHHTSESLAPKILNFDNKIKQAETNLFEAAKNYAKIVNDRLVCKPLQRKNMERKYEHSLEQLGAASLEYSIVIGSYPYNKEQNNE